MATFYSSWRSYGSGAQLRLRLTITEPSVGTGTTSVVPKATLALESSHSLYDSTNTSGLSGDLGSSSGNNSISHSSGAITTLRSVDATISTSYNGTVRVDVSGSITGLEVIGTGTVVTVSGTIYIDRRPYSTPGVPGQPSVSDIQADSVDIAWTAPASFGGAPSVRYDLYLYRVASPTNNVTYEDITTTSKANQSLAEPGIQYGVKVRASNTHLSNGGGTSDWSPVRTFWSNGVPSIVRALQILGIYTSSADIGYTAPAEDNGSPITSYDIQISPNSNFSGATTYNTNALFFTLTGLVPLINYYVRVAANNALGRGPWANFPVINTTPAVFIKKGGVQKSVVETYIKKSGSWKLVDGIYFKDDDVWTV